MCPVQQKLEILLLHNPGVKELKQKTKSIFSQHSNEMWHQ